MESIQSALEGIQFWFETRGLPLAPEKGVYKEGKSGYDSRYSTKDHSVSAALCVEDLELCYGNRLDFSVRYKLIYRMSQMYILFETW